MDMIDILEGSAIIKFDDEGYFTDPKQWSPRVADWLAVHDGLNHLSFEQWTIISFMREYYFKFGHAPSSEQICSANNMEDVCMDKAFSRQYKEAWRLAGLPNPGPEIKKYTS